MNVEAITITAALKMRVILFDTETTGLPKDRHIPAISRSGNWPDIVSISWTVFENERLVSAQSHIVSPTYWKIPIESTRIHGISDECAIRNGLSLDSVLDDFRNQLHESDIVVAHNFAFDRNVVDSAWFWHIAPERGLWSKPPFGWPKIQVCTAEVGKDLCKFSFADNPNRYRFPKLHELYTFLLNKPVPYIAHSSLYDTLALADIFFACPLSVWSLTDSKQSQDNNADRRPTPSKSTLRLDLSRGVV
jgi:DNA polymerase III epsilon subunit-like protein